MPREFWQGTNLPRVGGFNRTVVLDAIRAHGEISRVELAERTGLTAQTMSNIVRALMEDGLVAESGHAPSTGGKRRVLLRVVPDAYSAVGLHLDPERITGVLLDLAGGVRLRGQRRISGEASPSAVIAALSRTLNQLLRRSGTAGSRILGVGLAVPGPLDAAHRRVLSPPNLPGWPDVALADLLEQRTNLPVGMANDATAAAIGERWAGAAGSFMYVYLGSGVGVGLVLGDQVHRGVSNNAGEIGHITSSNNGRACPCGKRGCLEAYCSMRAIVADWRAASGTAENSATPVSSEYERVCRLAAEGDAIATRVLRQAATRLGHALAGVVSVLDIDQVVLGGPALRNVEELIRSRVADVLTANVWAPEVRPVRLSQAQIGEDAGSVGAASLVLDHAYAPDLGTLLGSHKI